MKKDFNKFRFFDAVLFNYMLKSTIKNKSLYVCLFIYFIVIFLVIFIIPKFGDLSPNQILLNPMVLSMIVLIISILSTLLGIILFKSPIDDGTELLIVSKPLSRWEILTTKIIIFFILSIIISILGSIFSSFIFLNSNTIIENNWFIVLGFFVGSFISFLFFGFLSLIICLFAKKIFVFISVCGLATLFFLITTLNSLMATNPIKLMTADRKYINSNIWINDTKNNKPNISTLSFLKTDYIENDENLQESWNFAKSKSNYYNNSYFDFGAQLGSFFLLIDNVTYAEWLISSMDYFSTPYDISFEEIDLLKIINGNKHSLTIKIKDDNFFHKKNNYKKIENISNSNNDDFNALPLIRRFFSFRVGKKSKRYEQAESNIYSGEWSSKYWDKIWNEFKMKKNNIFNLKTIYTDFLNFIIEKNKIIVDYSDNYKIDYLNQFSNILIDVSKSALYKVLNGSKQDTNEINNFTKLNIFNLYDIDEDIDTNLKMNDLFITYDKLLMKNQKFQKFIEFLKLKSNISNLDKDTLVSQIISGIKTNSNDLYNKLKNMSKNRFELKVLLNILSIYYPEKINNQFALDYVSLSYIIKNYFSTDMLELDFFDINNNSIKLPVIFNLPFFMSKFDDYNAFYEAKIVPIYNKKILFPSWIIITIIIAITSITLYYKRDFA